MKQILLDGKESIYSIDKDGRVFNTQTNNELKGSITENGYRYFRLSLNGKKYRFYAHRLVAEYYLEKGQQSQIVNHKNGNKLDNRVENLEWVTYSENSIHAYVQGLRKPNKNTLEKFDIIKDSYENERWVQIKNYPRYLVSSYGRICSKKKSNLILLKPVITNGYCKVRLCNNEQIKDELVAYLVYFNFHNEILKSNWVLDHIDGNKINNKLENLRYISRSENTLAAYYQQKVQTGIRPVICYKDGQEIGIYSSCSEAARQLHCDVSSISKCCRGKYSNHHGYIFKYQ